MYLCFSQNVMKWFSNVEISSSYEFCKLVPLLINVLYLTSSPCPQLFISDLGHLYSLQQMFQSLLFPSTCLSSPHLLPTYICTPSYLLKIGFPCSSLALWTLPISIPSPARSLLPQSSPGSPFFSLCLCWHFRIAGQHASLYHLLKKISCFTL